MKISKICIAVYLGLAMVTSGVVFTLASWFAPPVTSFISRIRVAGPALFIIGCVLLILSCVSCVVEQNPFCCSLPRIQIPFIFGKRRGSEKTDGESEEGSDSCLSDKEHMQEYVDLQIDCPECQQYLLQHGYLAYEEHPGHAYANAQDNQENAYANEENQVIRYANDSGQTRVNSESQDSGIRDTDAAIWIPLQQAVPSETSSPLYGYRQSDIQRTNCEAQMAFLPYSCNCSQCVRKSPLFKSTVPENKTIDESPLLTPVSQTVAPSSPNSPFYLQKPSFNRNKSPSRTSNYERSESFRSETRSCISPNQANNHFETVNQELERLTRSHKAFESAPTKSAPPKPIAFENKTRPRSLYSPSQVHTTTQTSNECLVRPKSQPPNYEEYTKAHNLYVQALEQEDNETIDCVPSKEPESAFISLSTGEDRRKLHSYHERLLIANTK